MSVPIASREKEAHRPPPPFLHHWAFAPVRWLLRRWRHAHVRTVELPDAEANFNRLLEDAARGKPFAIAIDGKPVIKVARMEKEDIDRLPKADD